MAEQQYELDAPGLGKIAAAITSLVNQNAALRAVQAANAPQATAFDQQGLQGVGGISGNTLYVILEAQAQNRAFSQLVMTFDAGSGAGRYRMDGANPTAIRGIPVPAGGVVLVITGRNNIEQFKLIAEAGQTLTFARYLFS